MHHSRNPYRCNALRDDKAPFSAFVSLCMGERERQEHLYSEFWSERRTDYDYVAKVTEEFLEVVRAVNDGDATEDLLEEVVHTSAVLAGWAQFLIAEKQNESEEDAGGRSG